jgi:hypothetical protein
MIINEIFATTKEKCCGRNHLTQMITSDGNKKWRVDGATIAMLGA